MTPKTIQAAITAFMKFFRKGIRSISDSDKFEEKNAQQDINIEDIHRGIDNIKESLSMINTKIDSVSNGTLCTLRNSILFISNKYILEGSIPKFEKSNLIDLHNAYTRLGGNSYEHKEYEGAMDLPLRDR